jgi:hypothetical protein
MGEFFFIRHVLKFSLASLLGVITMIFKIIVMTLRRHRNDSLKALQCFSGDIRIKLPKDVESFS